MDFINLNTEYETLNQFAKQGISTLTHFSTFLKTIHKYSDLFIINAKKSNDQMFCELLKYDSKSTLSKNFFDYFRNFENYMAKSRNILVKMEKELLEPINLFSKHISGKYSESVSEFKSIAYSTYEGKKSLEKSKHKYFDSCKLAVEQEKVVLKVMSDKEKNLSTDEEVAHSHEILLKLRLQAENNCQTYKSELVKTNKVFEENEKKYIPVIEKMKLNEESRINFIKFHFEKFAKILEEFTNSTVEMQNRLNNSVHEVNVGEDLKSVDEKLNFLYKNNERFPREEFLNYEIYRRNLEKMISNSQIPGINPSTINMNVMNNSEEYSADTNFSSTVNSIEDSDSLVDTFFHTLKNSESEITTDDLTKILESVNNNLTFSKFFIDKLLVHYKQTLYVQVLNYQNLHHFANILFTITNNTETKKDLFEMNFAIIYIAEKTFYINPENSFNKVYLCKLLSRNKVYNDRPFWMDLMGIKINSLIENKIHMEIQKREKGANQNSVVADTSVSTSNSGPNKSALFSIGSRVKNLFSSAMVKENRKVESSMIHATLYEQIKSTEAAIVVKEYILHFANFNLDVSEAIDIIVEFSQNYNYDKDKVSFFISLLNSSLFSIKNKGLSDMVNIDYNNFYTNKDFKHYLTLNDQTLSSVAYSIKFLDTKDYIKLLLLNKNFNRKLSKIVFKNVLFKYHNMDTKLRLAIWKNLLGIHQLKREVNYQDTLKEIEEKCDNSFIEPIQLDVQRTSFESDQQNKRAAILNILKATAYKKMNINYCQGMNYIAAFIYQLTNDEEEAFYFMYGIMTNTEYGDIFLNELAKLKQFFYVFDRILFIYLPELHIYFKNNSILVSYFISPWFITLFTNSYQYVNSNAGPKILIRIWDEFLLNGWKSVLKTGLCLIKHYENNLLSLKYEDLLHFLINDIIKYGFFQNSNYDYFINLSKNLKLQSGLISNLENEYMLDLKVKDAEEKRKEEQKKIDYEKNHSIKI